MQPLGVAVMALAAGADHYQAKVADAVADATAELIWSWGRRSMAMAGEVTRHG